MKHSFGSDNHSGIHPKIMESLVAENSGHAPSYGIDDSSQQLRDQIKQTFGEAADASIVFNGTAANVLCLKLGTDSFHSVICTDCSHLNVDECGAPEALAGVKLVALPHRDGKLQVKDLKANFIRRGDQHFSQVKMISLTQPTELGTVYEKSELLEIIKFAKQNELLVHMDGARLANACYQLQLSFKEMTTDLGIDLLSFGGTKNGLLGAELVVILNPLLKKKMKFFRKQFLQLPSKSRFMARQFLTYFENDLWKEIAKNSCDRAKQLEKGLRKTSGLEICYPVESNAVFVRLNKKVLLAVKKKHFFYIWDESDWTARLMTSFDSSSADVERFIEDLEKTLKETLNTKLQETQNSTDLETDQR